jgi:hypothetical protein
MRYCAPAAGDAFSDLDSAIFYTREAPAVTASRFSKVGRIDGYAYVRAP